MKCGSGPFIAAGRAQNVMNVGGLGEAKRAGHTGWGLGQGPARSEGDAKRDCPVVVGELLPGHERQSPPGRTARAMLANSAAGSPKNREPDRLMTTSMA
jgi:hypothetical protein